MYPSGLQSQQKLELDLPTISHSTKVVDGTKFPMRELNKEHVTCDGFVLDLRNLLHETLMALEFGGGKNESKSKSTSTLLVPKKEILKKEKPFKKRKAPSSTTILEKANFGSISKPKTIVNV